MFEKNLRSSKANTDNIDKILTALNGLQISYDNIFELELDRDDVVELKKHLIVLDRLRKKYEKRIRQIAAENRKIELVAKAIDMIAAEHTRTISDNSKRETAFLENTDTLKETLREIIVGRNKLGTYAPYIESTSIDAKSNIVHDYEFVSKLGISRIDTEYFLTCISSVLKHGSTINWETITEEELKNSLLRYDEETPVLQFFKAALIDKMSADLQPKRSIIRQGLDRYQELSSGMNSKIYFDLLTFETHKDGIYIIDQPEDNVSQKSIKSQLLESFKFMGENRQIIMVTHNPQFIVNLDVDNVIYISKENGNLQIQSGALEFECMDYKVLDIVAENVDGGLDSIQKRWKRYEKAATL